MSFHLEVFEFTDIFYQLKSGGQIRVNFYSIQEKGKLSLEEFTLDAERRAHGMRFVKTMRVKR